MARDVPTPLESSAQNADIYEQLRTVKTTIATEAVPTIIADSSKRPSNPSVGDQVYELATSSLFTWDGFGWRLPWNQPWGRVADAPVTSQQQNLGTAITNLAGLSAAWVATAGRRYRVDALVPIIKSVSAPWTVIGAQLSTGGTIGQAPIALDDGQLGSASLSGLEFVATVSGPLAVQLWGACAAGTYTVNGQPTMPAWVHVDDIGPATTQAAPAPVQAPAPPPAGVLGVVITSPPSGQTATPGTTMTITALATPATGKTITKVEFFVDGALVGTDTSSPFSAAWTTTAGPHSITAKVTQSDAAELISTPVPVTVSTAGGGGGGTTPPPTVGIPPKLHVSGLLLKDTANATVTLRGWNQWIVPGFVDSSGQMAPLTNWFDSHLDAVAQEWAAKGINCVRMPVMKDTNAAYTQRVVNAVNILGQRGMYVILTPYDAQTFGSWPTSAGTTGGGTSAGAVPVFGRSLTASDFSGATWSATDATSYPFTVTAPTNGRTVIAYVTTYQTGGTIVTPTVAAGSLGLTWTQRGTVSKVHGSITMRVTVFTGVGTPSGTTFTVNASSTQLGCGVQLSEFSNVDPTAPLASVVTGTGTAATAASITISPTPTSGMVWSGFSRPLQEGPNSNGTGWVTIDSDWGATPGHEHRTMYQAANAIAATQGWPSAEDWAGIACAIQGTGTGGGGGVTGTTNDVAVTTAGFLQTLWSACGKPSHLMLEPWHEPVGTAMTAAQWQSGMQAAIAQLRLAGSTMYDGPIICTTRNWGWSFDAAEATAIRVADPNVVFGSHRLAVQSETLPPLPSSDPSQTWKVQHADAAAAAGCALLMAVYGIYNAGFGTGGTKVANAQSWGAAMATEIQTAVAAGHCVGGLGWMWTWGGMDVGEDSENAGVDPDWPGIVAGQAWTYNAWGQVVQGMITALSAGAAPPPASGSPTMTFSAPSTAATGASVSLTATATPFSGQTISKVEFFVDGVLLLSDTVSPYAATWTATAGQHTVTATTTQSDAKTATASATILVAAAGGTAPLNGFQLEVMGTAFKDINGNRTVLRGTAQYLVEYLLSGSGAGSLYTWFTNNIAAVATEWQQKGANMVRIPITYNTASGYYLDLKAKVDALWAKGIMSMICAFDGAQYPVNTATSATRMKQMWDLIGSPSYCFIETTNEPNGITAATWQGYMNTWRSTLRAAGYKGIIFMGARDWSWTCDGATFAAVRDADVAVGGSKPGNVCFINHRYAVTDPANAVEPANSGAIWKGLWPDVVGPLGVCAYLNEWGPWNGGCIGAGIPTGGYPPGTPCTAASYGVGGSYDFNVNSWGEGMRQAIQDAVQQGNFGGAGGWMWAWSDNNTMVGANPEAGTTSYVEGTTGPPWVYNQWGNKMWSLVATLAGTPTLPGNPTVTHSAPSTAQTGNVVTITANPVSGGGSVTISQVQLLIDAAVVATDTAAPWSFAWTATTGTHTIQVKATQSDGKTATSASTSIAVTTTTPPSGGAGLLHVSGALLKDASNNTVFLRGLNQYIQTPYFDCGTGCYTGQYISDWFDSNIDRVAADWYAQGVRCVRAPSLWSDQSTAYKDRTKRIVQSLIGHGIYVAWNGFEAFNDDYGNTTNTNARANAFLAHWNYCGKPAMMMCNLWNEPNNGGSLSNSAWLTGSNAARATLRSGGYTGPIFLDAAMWATVYDSSSFTTLLSNDSGSGSNIVFSTHRYHSLCSGCGSGGFLPTNWCSTNWPSNFLSGAFCCVVGEYGWFNCCGNFSGGGQAFCNDATDAIITGKNTGKCAGAWAWMWTWDENSLVDPSQYNITQGAQWSYNAWGQIAKRMWANTAQGI